MVAIRHGAAKAGTIWGVLVMLLAQATGAERPGKPPKDAPFCLAPGTRPLFVAPMGQLFRGEIGKPYPAAAWIAAADSNRDGRISREEMVADADRFFARLDGDGNGHLTPDEVARYEQEVAPEASLYAGRREPEAGRRRGGLFSAGETAGYAGPIGAGRFAWLNIPEPVAAADADVDRVVTAAEFREAAGRRFDMLAAGAPLLAPASLPRTPQQAALEGPCRPAPKRRATDWEAAGDGLPPEGAGA
jgi:hypothetical protein